MQLREAADALGVHYQTAYLWVRQGSLPARKRGRGYEVDDADVRALAERRRQGSPPGRQIGVRDWQAQADQLYAAIAAGEETHARHWLGRLAAGVSHHRPVRACHRPGAAPHRGRLGGRAGLDRAGAPCERHLRAADRPARGAARRAAARARGGGDPAR